MTDPRIISLAATIFALLGMYNLYAGSRRMRASRLAGQPVRWYKQMNMLTGIEYILLTFVFLLSLVSQQGNIASGMRGLVVPLYFLLLILAAIIAGFVIRQSILNSRAQRASRGKAAQRNPAPAPAAIAAARPLTKREQKELTQRQRERRKKAAAARRRRAGKA